MWGIVRVRMWGAVCGDGADGHAGVSGGDGRVGWW